jgi:hypothetical protein
MEDIRQFRECAPTRQEERVNSDSPKAMGRTGLRAYNQTSQRLISSDVEVVEASEGDFEDCHSNLLPGSGSAIWIVPARGLSDTSFYIPVDLLYLDKTCAVLETVALFPAGCVSSSIERAASILALPAHAIVTMGIEAGDQLMLCGPEEIQRCLLSARPASLKARSDPPADDRESRLPGRGRQPAEVRERMNAPVTGLVPAARVPSLEAGPNLPVNDRERRLHVLEQLEEIREQTDAMAASPVPELAKVEEVKPAPITMPALPGAPRRPKVSWWRKLLLDAPDDQRWGERKALAGLVAYFFTGGAPTAQPVQNISTSGIYILTSERWFLGTYVRLTLAREREPRGERSITLHAKVIRSTDNGVAFEFLLPERIARLHSFASTFDQLPEGSTRGLREFIAQFESSS